jgi:hypothetical protein
MRPSRLATTEGFQDREDFADIMRLRVGQNIGLKEAAADGQREIREYLSRFVGV